MSEIWREHPDFAGYEVSDLGRVRSWKSRGNPKVRAGYATEMRTQLDKDGYPRLSLFKSDGKQVRRGVHQLVLLFFVGACPPGMEARHKNGTRADCRLSNLEWATHAINIQDKHVHGTMACAANGNHMSITRPETLARGERNGKRTKPESVPLGTDVPTAKLNEQAVREIRASTEPSRVLAARLGVCRTTIKNVRNGKIWRHVC